MRFPDIPAKLVSFRHTGYDPFPEQLRFHHSQAEVLQLVGAEGAGKSWVAANELVASILWCDLIYIVGQTYDNCHPEFDYMVEILTGLGVLDNADVSRPRNGSCQLVTKSGAVVITLSVERGAASVIARGQQPDIICLVEAGMISSYSVLLASVRRVTRSRGRVLLVGTMKDNFGWYAALSDELQSPGNDWRGETYSMPAWINTTLYPGGRNDPEIKRLESILPEDEFLRTVAAKKVPSPALIFSEFSYAKHVKSCPFDEALPVTIWIDPGYYPSAYAVVAAQFHGREVWVIDEIYLHHHTHEQVIEVGSRREWWGNVERSVIDIAGRQHHAQRSAAEIWASKTGIRPRSQQVGILDGIARHRTFLNGRMFHDPRCKNTLDEYKRYKRPTDRDGNATGDMPVDQHNHAMKAIAYGLVDRYGFVERPQHIPTATINFYGPPIKHVEPPPTRTEAEIERMLHEHDI